MLEKCDICGFQIIKDAHYCNGCGVDLLEGKTTDSKMNYKQKQKISRPERKTSEIDSASDDKLRIIKWCWIKTLPFPYVIVLFVLLAEGRSKIGFCSCATCNQGYREYLSSMKSSDLSKINANSHEIVKEVYGKDLSDIELDVAHVFGKSISKKLDTSDSQGITPKNTSNSILIEIPSEIIEAGIEKALAGENGQKMIREAMKRKRSSATK